jgi:hypothetical protein
MHWHPEFFYFISIQLQLTPIFKGEISEKTALKRQFFILGEKRQFE